MTVRFGLLGAGRIGKVHARAITGNPDARLVAVADADGGGRRGAGGAVRRRGAHDRGDRGGGGHRRGGDLHPDRHPRRPDRALRAQAGKAIFCEKPIDLDVARVQACLKVVEATGAKLMVGFNRRFDPHFRAVQAGDRRRRGRRRSRWSTSPRAIRAPPPVDYIRRSGGIFRDMTIHDFDMARWLLGEEPAVVAAFGAVLTDPAIGKAGRLRQRQRAARDGGRPAGGDLELAARDLRLRPAHRGAGLGAAWSRRRTSARCRSRSRAGPGFVRPPLLDFFMTRYTAAYAAEIATLHRRAARAARRSRPPGQDGLAALGARRGGGALGGRGAQGEGVGGRLTRRIRLKGSVGGRTSILPTFTEICRGWKAAGKWLESGLPLFNASLIVNAGARGPGSGQSKGAQLSGRAAASGPAAGCSRAFSMKSGRKGGSWSAGWTWRTR